MKDNLLEELSYFDLTYLRARDDGEGIKRGDVFIGRRKISHYPQIGRILTLKEGIFRNFKESFFVEEKFDGYNVRVFHQDGRLFALTRGGIVCPFSTDKLQFYDETLQVFFKKYPLYVLVGELVGMHNPYMDAPTTYELEKDVEIRFFDIMDVDGNLLLPEEKYRIFEEFGIPSVNTFGRFSSNKPDYEKLREVVLSLNAKRREGIVLKSSKFKGKYLKYVTPFINIMDIVEDAFLMAELPGNFYTSRILRYVISSLELGVRMDDEGRVLGESLINGIKKALQYYKGKGYIAKRYEITFTNRRNVEEFLRVFHKVARHVKLKEIEVTERQGVYVLSFLKVFMDSTEKLRDFLMGKHLYD